MKWLLPFLLLCLLVWVQASAYLPQHQRHHFSGQGCVLCLAGPLAFVQSETALFSAPAHVVCWVAPLPGPAWAQSLLLSTTSSRAPPA